MLGARTAAALVGAVAAATVALPAVASQAAPAPFVAPRSDRVVSGLSSAGVSAWGLAYNPVSDELAVGDYVAKQVRRFSVGGVQLGDFTNPKGTTQGVPSAIAVDPRDGSSYVAITGDGAVSKNLRKYDRDGTFMFDVAVTGSVTWVAVDAAGDVWYPGAFGSGRLNHYRIDDATKSATWLGTFGATGSGPCELKLLTGVAAAGDGRVFVADTGNRVVHVFDADGTCLTDLGATDFTGDLRGVALDAERSRLYVSDAGAGEIEVYDAATYEHLATLASLGDGPGQLTDGARQLTVLPDGHLLAADYGGRRVLVFAADGTYERAIPDPAMPADPAGTANPRGLAIDPATDDLVVADTWNQRVQRFAPDGTLLQVYGHRGSQPPDGMNYPKAVAVDPASGNLWVGNFEGNPDIVVSEPGFAGLVGRVAVPDTTSDIEITGGVAYVVNQRPGGVQRFDAATLAPLGSFATRLGNIQGIAVDDVDRVAWVTTATTRQLVAVSLDSGATLATRALPGNGWGVAIRGDLVFVAVPASGTVEVFDRLTTARRGSFGSRGSGHGQLSSPTAVAFDSTGGLWVLEARNGRIQRFTWDAPRSDDGQVPTVRIDPGAGTGSQVELAGTASDASGIFSVSVDVVRSDGLHWNAATATWTPKGKATAIVSGPITDVTWRFRLVATVPGATYEVTVRSTDFTGAISAKRTTTVTAP